MADALSIYAMEKADAVIASGCEKLACNNVQRRHHLMSLSRTETAWMDGSL